MRIAHIINSLTTGGAEKLIIDSTPILQDKNILVDVILLNNGNTPFSRILNEQTNGKVVGLTSKSVYNPFLIFKIISHLKNYDVVHVHLFPSLYWVVIAKIISLSKVKIVFTEHSTHNRRRDIKLFRWVDRFIYRQLDYVTAITEGVKAELKKHLKNYKNIRVINNGIDVKAFSLDEKPVFDFFTEDDFKLIQVSSFREQKDQATIIRSLKLLPEKVKLILVGDGNLIEDNRRLAEQIGVSDRVLFLGNRYDIPELMNYADVAILSSHWEGFGLAVLEGMAAGKPAIASDVDGVREIVDGYGLLFKQGDENELATQIESLMNNPEYYKEVAKKCKVRAQEYDIEKMVDEFIILYREILSK